VEGLPGPQLAFARLAHGIDCDAPDGQPVRLVFLLLIPPREYDQELQILAAIARLLTQPEVRRGLLGATSAREVVGILEHARQAGGRKPAPSAVGAKSLSA
jgi:PTS system nitrogen regulatory IIA component